MAIPATQSSADTGPYRVMVVDDSAVIRGIVTRWLEADPELHVVASCANGAQAVRAAAGKACEVIVLDIEMPEMDGITALPQLVKEVPGVQIVMSSTLTHRNADISLRALAMGAADYVTKPETLRGGATADDFRRELMEKVKALAVARRRRYGMRLPAAQPVSPAPVQRPLHVHAHAAASHIELRPFSKERPAILAIGSSTGGPQALIAVLTALGPELNIPVVITQHMPATFTALLADHLGKAARRPCTEGHHGELLQAGTILVAPGGQHMEIVKDGANGPRIALNSNPPENFCRPSVDPMFRSLARIYGPRMLGLILTGMGADGREGSRAVVAAGGSIVAQDEASSVVWGMPGAVATAGLCSAVLPLGQIAPELKKIMGGGARAS